MALENIKTRLFQNGKLRQLLKAMKQIVNENPDSEYARSVLGALWKKFWFGSKKVIYSNLHEEAWSRLIGNKDDGILEIAGMKFIYDVNLSTEFSDICLADEIQKYPVYNFSKEQKIAAGVLSLLSFEGPYTTDKVSLREDDIVIDAGADMGIFSLFAAKQNVKRVYAFEPQIKAIEILRKNIALNSMWNLIKIIPYGLNDKTSDLKLSHSKSSRVAASIVIQQNNYDDSEVIHCTTLDGWIAENNIKRIDFIKADIEGAERNMLMGATKSLQEFAPRLAICTYHLKDDPEVLKRIILSANSKYVIKQTSCKLFAYVPE